MLDDNIMLPCVYLFGKCTGRQYQMLQKEGQINHLKMYSCIGKRWFERHLITIVGTLEVHHFILEAFSFTSPPNPTLDEI